jgi:hypothetical protein
MSDTRKTAIYCRVALADKGKIAAQEARLRACAHRGLSVAFAGQSFT